MIVTRQRPKKREYGKYVLPLVAIVLLALAILLPPSRNFIVNGPLSPVWHVAGSGMDALAKPFHFAALNEEVSQRNRQIAALQTQVDDLKGQVAARDKQITALQSQVNQVMAQAADERAKAQTAAGPNQAAAAGATQTAGFSGGAEGAPGDMSQGATADMRRTANDWASMDADSAAKVVQKLPVPYVAKIFALMPSDAVGQILEALPAAYAAQLTQEYPALRR